MREKVAKNTVRLLWFLVVQVGMLPSAAAEADRGGFVGLSISALSLTQEKSEWTSSDTYSLEVGQRLACHTHLVEQLESSNSTKGGRSVFSLGIDKLVRCMRKSQGSSILIGRFFNPGSVRIRGMIGAKELRTASNDMKYGVSGQASLGWMAFEGVDFVAGIELRGSVAYVDREREDSLSLMVSINIY